jgi:hypothetical protein
MIDKLGPESAARYTSQHYNAASAASIGAAPSRIGLDRLDEAGVCLRAETDRVNILMPVRFGLPTLSLMEAFLHVRWKPIFEGRAETQIVDRCLWVRDRAKEIDGDLAGDLLDRVDVRQNLPMEHDSKERHADVSSA